MSSAALVAVRADAPPVRVVTAASLFDGHDAAINIMRRLLQARGAEVIHLGHDRGVDEIVDAALQEDAHAVCISSYQGGHMEYFRYLVEQLRARGAGHIRVYGGGGGVIVPDEIAALQALGVARIFSPEDGRRLGLEGMIRTIVTESALPFLPDTLGPRALLHVEKSFKRGMAQHLLAATESLGPLAERLASFDDEECRALAERVAAFVVAVRGGPSPP